MSLLFWGVVAVSFVVGVGLFPGLVSAMALLGAPRAVREIVARVTFTLGQIAYGAGALVRDGREYRIERMDEVDGGYAVELGEIGSEAETVTVVEPAECYRFGMRPFAVLGGAHEIDGEWLVDEDEALSRRSLAGDLVPEYRPWESGPLVDLSTVLRYWRGRGGNEIVLDSMEQQLQESGGQQQIGAVVTTIAFVVMSMLGAAMAWFIV